MFTIHNNDALSFLKTLPDNSVHLIVTDPPYFIDGMCDKWNKEELAKKAGKAGVIGGLPVGMKFNQQQGRAFQSFMAPICIEAFRVLKPGGFMIAFSQARLYGRLAVAVEDAGFEMRDMLGWTYEGQAKAFSQDHFVRKDVAAGRISVERGHEVITSMNGRKTPQLKPQIEPMTLAQKPRDGTFVQNWMKHQTGLVDTTQSLDGKFPGNLMHVPKPRGIEKSNNDHMTVKPVALIEHIIKLFSEEGQVVLDMFLGSGSHGVAAVNTNRDFIGVEVDPSYFAIAQGRLTKAQDAA